MKEISLYALIPCIALGLSACDMTSPRSYAYDTCENIAINRLKNPDSYGHSKGTEDIIPGGQTRITINFTAWNGYKVPIPYDIKCIFQTREKTERPRLLSITWNARPIRQHELEDIQKSLEK